VACAFPLKAWYPIGGGRLQFKYQGESSGQETQVACGQCMPCRLERSRQMAMRCTHEASLHEQNTYLTLTLDESNIPHNGSLDHENHWKPFFKRYRSYVKYKYDREIRFFMCGEYGEKLSRPHYHAIVFNHDFEDKEESGKNKLGNTLYRSEKLEKLWKLGRCWIGEATFESAAYVARYCTKQVKGNGADEHYSWFDPLTGELHVRQPEYCKMSTGRGEDRGIGYRWWKKYRGDIQKGFITVRGHKMAPPKYYDRLDKENFNDSYVERTEKKQNELRTRESDDTVARGYVKDHLAKKRVKRLIRGIEK